MHKHHLSVQVRSSFSRKSLRNSDKLCYFAPRKRREAVNFQDSTFIINKFKVLELCQKLKAK